MLDDVRQRLLDDPVERCSPAPGRAAPSRPGPAERDIGVDLELARRSPAARPAPSIAAARPSSSSAAGRSSVISAAQRGDLLAELLDGSRRRPLEAPPSSRVRAADEQDDPHARRGPAGCRRGARAPSAGARARRRRSSGAGGPRRHSPWRRRWRRWPRRRRSRRSSSSSNSGPGSSRSKAAITPSAVPRKSAARAAPPARPRRARAGEMPSRAWTSATRSGCSPRRTPPHVVQPIRRRSPRTSRIELAGGRRDLQLVAVLEQDHERAGLDQGPRPLHDRLEDAVEVGLAADRARDLGRRLEAADRSFQLPRGGPRSCVKSRALSIAIAAHSARTTRPPPRRPRSNGPPSFSVR